MADLEYSSELDVGDFVAGLRKMQQENEKTTKKMEDDFSKRLSKASDGFRKNLERTEKEARELQAALDLATKAGVKGIKKLDDETIKLNAALKKLKGSGQFSIEELEKGGSRSAAAFGLAAGAATVLIQKVLDLGAAAARAFTDIVAGGVAINQRLEDTGKVFTAVFGDPEIGQQVVDFLNETAERLNINRDLALEFGRSILPRTDSLETFTELLRLTDIQADTTGKSVGELSFAIREALTGDFVSIRDQFDLSKESVERIKALTPALGESAALAKVLGEEFERLGKINVTGTLTTDTKALQAQFSELQQILGEPVFESFKDLVAEIGDVLTEREEEFRALALSAGELTAAIVDLVGSNVVTFLENLDTEKIGEFLDQVKLLVENIDNFLRVTGLVEETLEGQGEALDRNISIIEKLSSALETATKLYILFKAGIAGATGGQEAFDQSIKDSLASLKEQNEELAKETTATKLDTDVVDEKLQDLNAQKEATEETTEATEEAVKAEEKLEEATKKTSTARKGASESEGDLTAARKKAAETKDEIAEAEEDLQAKILAAQKKAANELIQAEIDAAQKREDIARKNAQRIEDIIRKNRQARLDAATDLSRDEQDIATKAARAVEDFEREQAQKKIDIEVDYRKKLEDIQKDFNRSATQAERNRDAIAFLAALERKDQAIEDAQEQRQTEVDELKVQGEEKRAELERQRQQELEDARVANQRKLQDLQQSLQRELEEQRRANQQELEEARIAEQRKREEIQKSLDAQLEQLRAASQERIAALKAQLQEELAAIQQASRAARSGGGSRARGGSGGMSGIAGNEQFNRAKKRLREFATASGFFGKRKKRFAEGGPVLGLSPIIVGDASEDEKARHSAGVAALRETNPELFVGNSGAVTPVGLGGPEVFNPPEPGQIIPNNSVGDFFKNYLPPDAMARNLAEGGSVSNINNSRTINQNVGMLDPQSVSAIAVAAAQRTALEVVKGVVQ